MPPHPDHAALRYEAFARDVLAPAALAEQRDATAALEVSVHQCAAAISFAEAAAADYRSASLGFRWGPTWSTAWFRIRGRVPTAPPGTEPVLCFSCGTEALVWLDGSPAHGLGPNHGWAPLPTTDGSPFECFVEAACNLPLGASTFWWDERELAARWREEQPGRLDRCAVALLHRPLWRLLQRYEQARRLLPLLPVDSMRHRRVEDALTRVTDRIEDSDPARGVEEALWRIDAGLRPDPERAATTCIAVGHAHIDTGWLWPIAETTRKCIRTWSTVLELMKRSPAFTFTATQPQQYAWVRDAAPDLFARVRTRVAEGRWEASGAMWVEPDCNLVSGESIVRQITHAARWQRTHLGVEPARVLFLPDTFGFPATLPTIMAAAGIDTFITSKLAWSEVNVFPYTTFDWHGLDGSVVTAHAMPSHEYNAGLLPEELARGERNAAADEVAAAPVWLQPFGFGDGGGGPTPEMVERLDARIDAGGLPIVEPGTLADFRNRLHEAAEEGCVARGAPRRCGTWHGPLDLEMHRGTYTTQAWLKAANARAEAGLRAAEWLDAADAPERPGRVRADQALDDAWKRVLLHQFHDILPGTSIGAVYDTARADHATVAAVVTTAIERGACAWAERMDRGDASAPVVVFNAGSVARSGIVEHDGRLLWAARVPALGSRVIDADAAPAIVPIEARGHVLANGIVRAEIDPERGVLCRLQRVGAPHAIDATGSRAGHALALYEDRPRRWEAWDIDAEYARKPLSLGGCTVEPATGDGTLRGAIRVRHESDGCIVGQEYRLDAGSSRLDVVTTVDWDCRRRLLRAECALAFAAPTATCAAPFGAVVRPTHANTAWERARFEVPASGWVDMARPGVGLSLIAPTKYGFSLRPNALGVSLLRGTSFPDPDADRGRHVFTYALLPHDGDWRRAGTPHERDALRRPLHAVTLPEGAGGARGEAWAPIELEVGGTAGVEVSSLRVAETLPGVVVRCAEIHGGSGTLRVRVDAGDRRVLGIVRTDVLEQPVPGATETPGAETSLELRPFELVTLLARCEDGAEPIS